MSIEAYGVENKKTDRNHIMKYNRHVASFQTWEIEMEKTKVSLSNSLKRTTGICYKMADMSLCAYIAQKFKKNYVVNAYLKSRMVFLSLV